MTRLHTDFNGLFGGLLCLSHEDTCPDEAGNPVPLRTGMIVTAFEPDIEDGQPTDLVATCVVECSSDWRQCAGSRQVLRIDGNGVWREPPATLA